MPSKPHQLATNMKLENKIIFITGATKGIGFELAKRLLAKNNTVIIGGRNQKELDIIALEFDNIYTLHFDVLNNKSLSNISRIIEQQFGRLEVLVNNAAVLNGGNFYETDYSFEKIETEILTNIASPVKLIKSLLPLLSIQKQSVIVNITSGVAYMPMPYLPVYSATKAALQSFTYSLRANLKNTNIKVFEALPPLVATQMTENMKGKAKDMKKITPNDCAKQIINGIEKDNYTIHIGSSKSLFWGRRIFPKLVQTQLNKM
jgi:uncharacterized oxidoreductase